MMPFNPFSALTSKIFGGVSIALLLALGILWTIHKHDQHRNDQLTQANATLDAKLAVSNASIEALKQAAAEMIGAGKAAKLAQLAAVEKVAKDNAALQGQADTIRKEVAGMKPDGKCATPASVKGAKGL